MPRSDPHRAFGLHEVCTRHMIERDLQHLGITFDRQAVKAPITSVRTGWDTKVVESRKQAVSIRMSTADVRKVKKLAQRIGVRDSDVIRFAVKSMLNRLGPLYDPEARGRSLVPVFVESGTDLLRFFELDAARLEAIINDGVDATRQVDRGDIALLALVGGQEPYAALMLSELKRVDRSSFAPGELSGSLRQYLYDKYVYRGNAETCTNGDSTQLNGAGALP